jgi:dTDP-4-dehydrorhamnose 3,5-epimerase
MIVAPKVITTPADAPPHGLLPPGQVRQIPLTVRGDDRGSLIAIEGPHDTGTGTIPFAIRRVYYIFNTTPGVVRGQHAHRQLDQLLVATSGQCRIVTDTGLQRQDTLLNSPATGLYLNGTVWREMHDFSADCVLMVLASEPYTPDDYIWDYQEFLHLTTGA